MKGQEQVGWAGGGGGSGGDDEFNFSQVLYDVLVRHPGGLETISWETFMKRWCLKSWEWTMRQEPGYRN